MEGLLGQAPLDRPPDRRICAACLAIPWLPQCAAFALRDAAGAVASSSAQSVDALSLAATSAARGHAHGFRRVGVLVIPVAADAQAPARDRSNAQRGIVAIPACRRGAPGRRG